jgi:hypothetical protein
VPSVAAWAANAARLALRSATHGEPDENAFQGLLQATMGLKAKNAPLVREAMQADAAVRQIANAGHGVFLSRTPARFWKNATF